MEVGHALEDGQDHVHCLRGGVLRDEGAAVLVVKQVFHHAEFLHGRQVSPALLEGPHVRVVHVGGFDASSDLVEVQGKQKRSCQQLQRRGPFLRVSSQALQQELLRVLPEAGEAVGDLLFSEGGDLPRSFLLSWRGKEFSKATEAPKSLTWMLRHSKRRSPVSSSKKMVPTAQTSTPKLYPLSEGRNCSGAHAKQVV